MSISESNRWILAVILSLLVFPLIFIAMGIFLYDLDVKAGAGAIIGGAIGAFYGLGIHLLIFKKPKSE